MQDRTIYWHLPGFYAFRYLNQIVINLMKDYPQCFNDGYKVGSVYGTFPGAIWNGGRAVFGLVGKQEIERLLATYNEKGVPVRFTWTNSLLTEDHTTDTYCNLIMRLADNGMNQVLANTDTLEKYIRSKYPNYKFISSTTKRITDLGELKDELSRDYFLVVLDYDLNHNEEVLAAIETMAEKVEILVDEICYPNCPHRKEHYKDESLRQLEFDVSKPFPCPNRSTKPEFAECMKRPAFISKDEIESYIDRGFVNFKLVGRGLPQDMLIDSYVYYLVKDDEQAFIRKQINTTLESIRQAMMRR